MKMIFGGHTKSGKKGEKRIRAPTAQTEKRPGGDEITVKLNKRESYVQILTAGGTHIGTREYQQDALFVSESARFVKGESAMAFGVLCDGMGGMEKGEAASGLTVDTLVSDILQMDDHVNIPAFLEAEIIKLDELLTARCENSGTTLTACVIIGDLLYWASVGDSRIYILRKDEIVQVTRDHNYLLRLREDVISGKLTDEEANSDPKREALISYIGAGGVELMDVNKTPFQLENGDIVLMCSDGLNKSLSDERIKEIISEHYGNIAEAANYLPLCAVDADAGPKDNISVILIQYFE
jgi:protein phosphatase